MTGLLTTESSYSGRVTPWGPEVHHRLAPDALCSSSARANNRIAYASIRKIRVHKIRYLGSRTTYWRCVLQSVDGERTCLQAAHYVGFRRVEDRSASYIPFIKQLEARIAAANPTVVFEQGSHWLAVGDAVLGWLAIAALGAARRVNVNVAAVASAFLTCKIGPLLKGHRIARANLIAAYPEKSSLEIERILRGMWDNLGRVFAEYAHLDRLWDFDPGRAGYGRIVLDPKSRRRFAALVDAGGPILVFGAHLANWELLSWAVGKYRGKSAIIYRAPKIASVDHALKRLRMRSGTTLIPADARAIFAIINALRRGAAIGVLVDEHFPRGVNVTFFGRSCKATPIFARYARKFNCPIYGGRLVRLPDGKFRLDLTDAIPAPRDAEGKIDVAATTQMIINVIEGWIREYPEQWLWLQRRWR